MKRIISFFIAIVCISLCSCTAAEQFTLHSQVAFGMSIDEVIAMENAAGFPIEEASFSGHNRPVIYTVKGKVAGIEDSKIFYFFDNEGKLYAATYALGGTWLLRKVEPAFSTVQTALEKKYGIASDTLPDFAKSIGFEPKFDYWESYYQDREDKSVSFTCKTWIIEQDDKSQIVIAHYKDFVGYDTFAKAYFYHVVGYQKYTREEIDDELDNMSLEKEENELQLSNDL